MKKGFKILLAFLLVIGAFLAGLILLRDDISLISKKSVPDMVVHEYFDDYIDMSIDEIASITHDYNAEVHIDNVTVTFNLEREYGIQERIYYLQYQYYSSDDLWKLVNQDNKTETYWNEEKLEDVWTAEDDDSRWVVNIIDFDSNNNMVTLNYVIRYLDYYGEIKSGLHENNATYEIYYMSSIFLDNKIDSSGVSRDISIEFDLDNGVIMHT